MFNSIIFIAEMGLLYLLHLSRLSKCVENWQAKPACAIRYITACDIIKRDNKRGGVSQVKMIAKTPMMRQYQEIKKQYPDTILFFRLGDFYEMFHSDAELASRELEITLTGRDAGLEKRVPMCGVPYHAADNYINKLIQKGYKVAICEQVEDPRECKGLVRREVIRLITPGTTLDTQLLPSQNGNYLAALTWKNHSWGLAFFDVSTREFYTAEIYDPEGVATLRDEMQRLNPAELLIPEDFEADLPFPLDSTLLTPCPKTVFSYNNACEKLRAQFRVKSLEALGCQNMVPAVCSAGAIITYLEETQKAPPRQIKTIQQYCPESFMMLDSTTYRNLELTRTIRYNERKGSLLDIMDKTKTAPGARLLRFWLERPLMDKNILEERLGAVEILAKNWSFRQDLRKYLEEVYDLERLMTRILYQRATPRELISLKNSLAVLPAIKKTTAALANSPYLAALSGALDTLEDISLLLEQSLESDPPYNLKEGGVIKNGYHPEVDSLREASRHGKEWIARLESEEKEKSGIKSLKVGYNKVFGYYFEVTKANLGLVPPYFRRKQTLANGERYVTEELIRLESQVLGAEEKLLALEEKVYLDILGKIGQEAPRVQETSRILARIDVLQSMAEVAVRNNYIRPRLLDKDDNYLHFKELRHPVVEKLATDNVFVPNDLEMSNDINLYIITGPNMGGKSTFCRSVALAVIMAQAGSFVPAKEASISIRDRVFARVGASDDLGSGQSTFMVEMNEVANILRHASSNSLVILDEVGRGTSTYDGLSMAWSVSEYLVRVLKTKTLFATHYHELTQLAQIFPSIKNLSLAVREKGDEIIFLYKIIDGPSDKSYGIQVGRLAGLPGAVIGRAKEILAQLETEHLEKPEKPESPAAAPPAPGAVDSPCHPQVKAYLEALAGTDLHKMTPLEALNRLYQLKQLLADSESECV